MTLLTEYVCVIYCKLKRFAPHNKTRRRPMTTKKPATKKPAAKAVVKKGTKYFCDTCGMVVSVETVCGCEEVCLVCCDEPMKMKK